MTRHAMVFEPLPISLTDLAAERLHRLRSVLAESGRDAALVTGVDNVLYVTGYESLPGVMNAAHRMMAMVTEDKVLLIAPAADFAPAIAAGLSADDVIPYGVFFFSGNSPSSTFNVPHKTFDSALREGLTRIAARHALVQWEQIPEETQSAVSAWCDDIAPATEWMLNVRAVKSAMEQAMLRHVGRITERALEAGIAAAAVGITDKEVANIVAATMAAGGGLPRNVTTAGGLRSALADVMASEHPLKAGDLLRFDLGCSYYGYQSDIARTAVLGEPTPLQQQRYDALLAGLETAIETARAGTRACDIFHQTIARVEAAGLVPYRRQHVGHAIGLSTYELPVVTPSSETRLRLGSTFCLETPYYEPGWGGMMVEDTGVVTEQGFECFTQLDRALRIISV